jgi:hypothetical protein
MSFDRKKLRTRSFEPKFILARVHLTGSFFWKWSFDRKVIWPKLHLTESFLRKMVLWPIRHLTKRLFDRKVIYSGLMQIQKWEKLFRFKWWIKVVLPFVKNFFGPNFPKYFRSNDLLINFVFGQITFFGKMDFRSNGLRLNGDSVKRTFDHMAFGQTVFGQMVFWSNRLSVKKFRWNDFSVKWSRTEESFQLNINGFLHPLPAVTGTLLMVLYWWKTSYQHFYFRYGPLNPVSTYQDPK